MAKQLTARQRQVLDTIRSFMVDKGYGPSIRELGAILSIGSLRGVTIHLDALEKKGWISRENKSRSIRILGHSVGPSQMRSVPLLGTISAGLPLLAVENVESYISVPGSLGSESDELFALKVRGDSMIDDHIVDGDIIVVRKQASAEHGQIVAALIGEEATVKRLDLRARPPRLLPANQNYQPIELPESESGILGRVVGLVRPAESF